MTECKKEKNPNRCGSNHPLWKGGISIIDRPEYMKIYNKKHYELNKERFKVLARLKRANGRTSGKITLETLQMLYEDSIKKYGTLTCYLCEKSIKFGKDSIDHKMPISKGGTNEYINLGIAHRSCNCKKRVKTLEEYYLSEFKT